MTLKQLEICKELAEIVRSMDYKTWCFCKQAVDAAFKERVGRCELYSTQDAFDYLQDAMEQLDAAD